MAVEWCKMRNESNVRCVLDVLGEYARNSEEALEAAEAYSWCVNIVREKELNASITVKLTALGALFDKESCKKLALTVCREASIRQVGFEIDMEGPPLVDLAIGVAKECAKENGRVTLAVQAYLNRTPKDLEEITEQGIRPRLVKGAYLGDTTDFAEIQQRFKSLVETCINRNHSVCLGTHDPEIINWAQGAIKDRSLAEFSFLKGLADQTKLDLAKLQWTVSEYVPFGEKQQGYQQRRLRYLSELNLLGRKPLP